VGRFLAAFMGREDSASGAVTDHARTMEQAYPILGSALLLGSGARAQDAAAVHQRMPAIAAELDAARSAGAAQARLDELQSMYSELSRRVGGDDPANASWGSPHAPSVQSDIGPHFQVGPACGGASVATATFAGTVGPIPTTSLVEFSLQASGLGASLTNLVAVPLLAPEGSFDNVLGQNPTAAGCSRRTTTTRSMSARSCAGI